jgi:hypothetical protein
MHEVVKECKEVDKGLRDGTLAHVMSEDLDKRIALVKAIQTIPKGTTWNLGSSCLLCRL